MNDFDYASLPPSFFRVSVKCIIFNDSQEILVLQKQDGLWEMPGGGLEVGESLEDCVKRELDEEVRATVTTVGPIDFTYQTRSKKGFPKLCIVVPVTIAATELVPTDDQLVAYRYVDKTSFAELTFQVSEQAVLNYIDKLWSLAT